VKWLVTRGAHLGEQEGGTPLNNAVWSANLCMVLLLLGLNADPNLFGSCVSTFRKLFLLFFFFGPTADVVSFIGGLVRQSGLAFGDTLVSCSPAG